MGKAAASQVRELNGGRLLQSAAPRVPFRDMTSLDDRRLPGTSSTMFRVSSPPVSLSRASGYFLLTRRALQM